jgi:plastocyanin
MLKRTLTTLIVVAALGTGAAACGGSGDDSASTAAAKAPAPTTTTAPSVAGPKVAVGDNTFSPGTIKVSVGDTITWNNGGAVAHTVTATDGADFDSGTLEPGKSFTFTADKAGTISYVCNFHAGMQGTIQVG